MAERSGGICRHCGSGRLSGRHPEIRDTGHLIRRRHVLEDLVAGNSVQLRAQSKGTDCYPRKTLEIDLTLEDMNQATMVNPRNSYQSYVAASNTTDRTLYTYMGALLPNTGNVSYSGAGCLSPPIPPNDPPDLRIIGSGVPIFLCGAEGMIIGGEGTQPHPATGSPP